MKIITLDCETYFDADYSLKKMTTEAYVRDPRFHAHMVGLKYPGRPAIDILPGMLASNSALRAEISTSAVLCHHAQFDAFALNHWFGLRPAFILDTLAMARLVLPRLRSHALGALAHHFGFAEKNVPYHLFTGVRDLPPQLYPQVAAGCRHDVELTWAIFQKLLPYVPPDELRIIDLTARMFTEPCLELDRPRLEAFHAKTVADKRNLMLNVGALIGAATLEAVETALQSSDKFAIALRALGYACPMKWSAKQGKEIPALAKGDDGMKQLENHHDQRVQTLAAARQGVKSTIDETRSWRLLDTGSRGPLPVYLKYAAAKTLRFGGGDSTNWQNFRRGGEIRKSIKAPQGHKLVIGDLSQIEYRLLCWLTGQVDKLEALKEGRDLYCEFASELYRETVTKADKARRGTGKQGTLQCGYGAGAGSIIVTAESGSYGPPVFMTGAEGLAVRDLYRKQHPRVVEFWAVCERLFPVLATGGAGDYKCLAIEDHCIWLPNETALDYTGLRWGTNSQIFPDQADDGKASWWEATRKGYGRIWGSKLTADIIQGLARVVIAHCMVRLAPRMRIVLQVHDEIVGVVPDADAADAERFMLAVMTTPPAWCADAPIAAETIVSDIYEK